MQNKLIKEKLLDYEGKMFLCYQQRYGQAVIEMVKQTGEMFVKNNLSIAEAKGFLEYMKLIIEFNPCTLTDRE